MPSTSPSILTCGAASYAPPVAFGAVMVGSAVFDTVLPLLNPRARIPVCGLIVHYNDTELPPGPDLPS
ncbi:hypothetical protein JCM30471_29490 [Desulfuromonas carbonis]